MEFLYIGGIWVFGTSFLYLIRSGSTNNKLKIMSCRNNLKHVKRMDSNDTKSIF